MARHTSQKSSVKRSARNKTSFPTVNSAPAISAHKPRAAEISAIPLGALMLAASVSGWAQTITAVPSTPATATATTQLDGKTLAPVTIKDTRDRATQTYQSGVTTIGKVPVAAKDVPQSLTVVNEKLIHDQGRDTFKGAPGKCRRHYL